MQFNSNSGIKFDYYASTLSQRTSFSGEVAVLWEIVQIKVGGIITYEKEHIFDVVLFL